MLVTSARLHAIVRGRVQGVGFRAFVQREAMALGLGGTVRNLYFPRQQVEVVAEGPEDALNRLLGQLRAGPRLSGVDQVDVTWEPPRGEFTDFRIVS